MTPNFTAQSFTSTLSGLTSGTTYYYRMVFNDTDNRTFVYGAIRSFTTKTPVMTTSAASSVTSSGAVLNGRVNPEGANGYAGFYWGTDPNMNTYNLSCTYWYECAQVTANYTTQPFSATLSGLASNTIYYYQMVFYDTDNRTYQYGAIRSFTTKAPIMTTSAASSVTSSGGTMNGKINPEGANGYAGFYWGTDPNMNTYSLSCTYWYECAQVTANYTTQTFSATLSGLASNTIYYYQIVFYDTDNRTYQYGAIRSFTTKTSIMTTSAASSVTSSGGTLNGKINPEGANGYAGFYWGTDPQMNTYTLSCTYWYECAQVTANYTTQSFSAVLSGLASNTTYYYQMVFNNTDNHTLAYGAIKSFTTKNPTVSTLAATSITGSGATMNGEVDPRGANGYAGFYWGTDPNMNTYSLSCSYWYGCATVVANFVTQSFSSGLSGLSSNTTYYYREVFNDADNNSYKYGSIHSFTTQ